MPSPHDKVFIRCPPFVVLTQMLSNSVFKPEPVSKKNPIFSKNRIFIISMSAERGNDKKFFALLSSASFSLWPSLID